MRKKGAEENIFPEYRYDLPDELIASVPAEPRDSARLFVYDTATDTVTSDTFHAIGTYLPAHAVLVLNQSTVRPARVSLKKKTGGAVEVFFLLNEMVKGGVIVRALVDRRVFIGESLSFPSGEQVTALSHDSQYFTFRCDFPFESLLRLLERHGTAPIPKYIGKMALSKEELQQRYQTVFAAGGMSVAAPTASLHFTPELLTTLSQSGFSAAYVSLEVGLGTFAPLTDTQISSGRLHTEYFSISAEAAAVIVGAKRSGQPVVAVGTTALRTIESAAGALHEGSGVSGATDIFIRPPYEFKIADALITNFHLPQTSLMALVDAFLVHKKAHRSLVSLYQEAIVNRFRFYSFGDAMLIR